MELNQLRYFLDVAHTQHVTRSAERLHLAQPALTRAIRRLEEELGVPLFVAKGRGIVLTEYGKFLQSNLTPLLTELDSLPERLQIMANLTHATVHLNVLAASTLVTEAVIQYQKGHPDVRFQLTQNHKDQLYDIGVTTRLFYQQTEGSNIFVHGEQIFLAVPDTPTYAERDSIRLSDVAQESFISLMGSSQLRWICDKFCAQAGFTPKIALESDSPAAVRNMIAANMGVGFWPQFSWGKVESDRVRLLPITEPICRRDILIDVRHNKQDNRVVDDFYAFLCRYIANTQ